MYSESLFSTNLQQEGARHLLVLSADESVFGVHSASQHRLAFGGGYLCIFYRDLVVWNRYLPGIATVLCTTGKRLALVEQRIKVMWRILKMVHLLCGGVWMIATELFYGRGIDDA